MPLKFFRKRLQLLLGLLLSLCRESSSLRSMVIIVPEVVQSGDTVTLSCEYDLEQVALYSIKWYWNDEEFYRFVPKESPPFRAFTMEYVNVDISRSGPNSVTLRGVRRELTGNYKCEVSADGPLFHTDIKVAHMTVAELPSGDPVLSIDPLKVEIGKRITAQCYSPGSDPAANISWFINDEEVTDGQANVRVFPLPVELDKALNLQSPRSRIEIIATRQHFIVGIMTIKCEASIYSLWRRSVEDVVRDDTPHLAPVLGSTSSQSQLDPVQETSTNHGSWTATSVPVNLFSFLLILRLLR